MEPVIYEVDGLTAIIRINRPDKLNALDESVIQGLRAALRRYDVGPERCAILCAEGDRAFSVGADIKNAPKEMWQGVPGVGVVTNKPIILGGGLELTKKYVIEQEQEPNEDFSALLDPKEKKKAEAADEDTSQPQAAPAIAFQISATPYESKTAEPKKNDVVPRLELTDIIVNQGKVQEAFQHNIPADSASGLRPSNLMSSTSSYVSSSHNQ